MGIAAVCDRSPDVDGTGPTRSADAPGRSRRRGFDGPAGEDLRGELLAAAREEFADVVEILASTLQACLTGPLRSAS